MSCMRSGSPAFQSTLPSEERSDGEAARRLRPQRGFNPRSPPKRGATLGDPLGLATVRSFNPRSPPKRGATRSKLRSALGYEEFQSTLPSEERSDCHQRF